MIGTNGVVQGMIHTGIPTHEKQRTPIFSLKKGSNHRKKEKKNHLQLS